MAELGLVISHLFKETRPAARLLVDRSQVISPRFLPEPAWLSAYSGRRIFHWGLGPVEAEFQRAFLRQGLDRYLSETRVDLFSFDLGPSARRHQGILPLSPPLGPSDIFRQTEASLKLIRRFYQGPLAAENYNYYPSGLYGHITEPEFINSYLEAFDLGLTLDLAHAAVTAHNLGLETSDYCRSLPLEKTAEIHVSRPWLPKNKKLWAVDAHLAPSPREWDWLKEICRNRALPRRVPVFVEYYRDLSKLKESQERLTDILDT